MPRKPRFFLPNIPVHAITRGNNKNNVFNDDEDKHFYMSCLFESSEKFETDIHAYVLMDNHIHLLISSNLAVNISSFMQHIGRRYVPYFNQKYGHTGTLWEGRFKASLVDDERYLLSCYRYIELNPVRAKMVDDPGLYKWSSYHCNALGKKNTLVKPHDVYIRLANKQEDRINFYRQMFNTFKGDDVALLKGIRDAVQTGTPLGDRVFINSVESLLSVDVGQSKRGRPKKGTDPF